MFTSFSDFFPTQSEEEVAAHLGKSILPWKIILAESDKTLIYL